MLLKQQNDLFCYYDVSTLKINMTKEEYIEFMLNDTKKYLERQFEENDFASIQSLIKCKTLSDEQLKLMGYEKTYDEMLKYIPSE